MKVPTGGESPRPAQAVDQVELLGRRSQSGWEKTTRGSSSSALAARAGAFFAGRRIHGCGVPAWPRGAGASRTPILAWAVSWCAGTKSLGEAIIVGRACARGSRGAGAGRRARTRRHAVLHPGAVRSRRAHATLRRCHRGGRRGAGGDSHADPNPLVDGRGFARLKDGGVHVDVLVGAPAQRAARLTLPLSSL